MGSTKEARAQAEGRSRRAWRDLVVLARLLPQVSTAHTVLGVVLAVGSAALTIAFSFAAGAAVGDVADPDGGSATGTIAVVAGLFLVRQLFTLASGINSLRLVRHVNGMLRERVMAATLRPETVDVLRRPEALAVIERARELAPMGFTPGAAARALLTQLQEHAGSVCSLVALVAIGQWKVAVLMALARGFGLWQGFLLFWKNVSIAPADEQGTVRARYFRDLGIRAGVAKELRVFGLLDWTIERSRSHRMEMLRREWAGRRNPRQITAVAAASTVAMSGASLVLGLDLLDGRISVATLGTGLFLAGQAGAFNLSDDVLALAYGAAVVPAIVDLDAALPGEHEDTAHPTAHPTGRLPLPERSPRHTIEVRDVAYTYPGADRPVFEHLDLRIDAGTRLAVVGLNGAGKTTLVRLLCGLLEPDAGRILVDGVDLADVDPASWRRSTAALFQDFVRYHLSARDNVALGAPDADLDDARLDRLAHDVGVADFVAGLPDGWDTVLSPQFTGGVDLSGGQWQRLALARALRAVDGGARLLILDEPTANLDVRAEAQLYDRFLELTGSDRGDPLTTVVISHRFSTVRRADRIVVLESGAVAEDGTHDELLALDGRYASLLRLQADRFTDA